jgi:hypothetical protein
MTREKFASAAWKFANRVHPLYVADGWKWNKQREIGGADMMYVPSVADIYDTLLGLFNSLGDSHSMSATGGLRVSREDDGAVILSFSVDMDV